MSAHYRLDGFLLEKINVKGAMEAGIYAAAYRLLDAANMMGYLVASYLLPFIARNLTDKETITEAIESTRHVLLFSAIGLVLFVFNYAGWIQKLLYHTDHVYDSVVLQLCLASLPAYYLVHIYGSVLTATGRLRTFIAILFTSVLINILLNILLIPDYGAEGCCIAALASQYFCGITCWITVSRTFEITYRKRSVLIYLFTACFIGGFFYFSKLAMVNVWISIVITVFIILFLFITQISYFKKLVLFR
jgi:O-antigen/teichoic acid export membrane protein